MDDNKLKPIITIYIYIMTTFHLAITTPTVSHIPLACVTVSNASGIEYGSTLADELGVS